MHAPAFVVLGTWPVVLMFRDYSRELGLVGLSGLRLVRLPFGVAVHVRPPRDMLIYIYNLIYIRIKCIGRQEQAENHYPRCGGSQAVVLRMSV